MSNTENNLRSLSLGREITEPDVSKKRTIVKKDTQDKNNFFRVATRYWEMSQEQIRELEEKLHARVISLYFNSTLSTIDVDYIHSLVALAGHQKRIAVWLDGPGGAGTAAYRIVFMLRQYCDELIFVIPSMAASACTMMSLGGDKILMGPASSLSPIDSSIQNHPLAPKDMDGYPVSVEITEIQKFIDLCNSNLTQIKSNNVNDSPYGLLAEYVHPVFIGAIQRAVSVSKLLTTAILKTHMEDEKRIDKIVDQLNDTFPTHGYPIVLDQAQELGIQAESMDRNTQEVASKLLVNMQKLAKLKTEEDDNTKTTYTMEAIFEARDYRTVYLTEKKFSLIDKKWEEQSRNSGYYSYRSSEASGKIHIEELE